MNVLPLFGRDLVARSRRRWTYWLRVAVASAATLACMLPLMSSDAARSAADDGKAVFDGLIVVAFLVCCGGCLLTADALGSERLEGTLELLFLTRVKPLDVLMGKLASCGVTALCAVTAFLPMLMVPVLAGGVTGGEAFRKGLALMATLLLALVIGLRASVFSTGRFIAARKAVVLLGVLVLVPFLAGTFFDSYPFRLLETLSPLGMTDFASDDSYQQTPELYWISLGIAFALVGLLLARASRQFPHTFAVGQFEGKNLLDGRRRGVVFDVERKFPPAPPSRFQGPPEAIEALMRHHRGIRAALWTAPLLIVAYAAFSWAVLNSTAIGFTPMVLWAVWAIVSGSWDGLVGAAASRFFYDAKRTGQLEALVTTPLGGPGLLESHWLVLKKLLRWPIVASLLAIFLITVLNLDVVWNQSLIDLLSRKEFPAEYMVSWFFDFSGTVLEAYAVCWVGIWVALKGQSQLATVGWAAAAGTAAPALLKTGFWLLLANSFTQQFQGDPWSSTFLDWLQDAFFLFYYLWVIRFAKSGVKRELGFPAPQGQHSRSIEPGWLQPTGTAKWSRA